MVLPTSSPFRRDLVDQKSPLFPGDLRGGGVWLQMTSALFENSYSAADQLHTCSLNNFSYFMNTKYEAFGHALKP